jgi:hypothetical protein
MARKQQKVSRKPSKKVADAKRVRFGTGMAPAHVVRTTDSATQDTRAIRFGTGMISPGLRK